MRKICGSFTKIFMTILAVWSSRKLWMTVTGITILWLVFWRATHYLYSFTEQHHVVAFESMFQTTMYAIVAAILGYLGVQGMENMKRSVSSATQQVVQSLFSKEEVKIDQNITVTERYDPVIEKRYADKYASDESYRPPATVPDADPAEDFR